MNFAAFIGSSYESQSLTAAAQVCRNLYVERIEVENEPVRAALYPTPGLLLFKALPHGPIRGSFAQDGRYFVVGGDRFYEVYANGTYTERGTVAFAPTLVSFASNGTAGQQLLIVSAGMVYIYNLLTHAFGLVTDPECPQGEAAMARFSDGYFFVLRSGTRSFAICDIEDGLVWSGLDLAERSHGSDNLLSFDIEQRYLYLWGSKTSEVWYNSGNADFPFEPVPGIFIEDGIVGPHARTSHGGHVYWISANEQGAGTVQRAVGYNPIEVSTHAIARALQGYSTLHDAELWPYQQEGHTHIVLNFPTADKTWVFDPTTRLWHERSWRNTNAGTDHQMRARCHAHVFGKHLVGDRENGNLYEWRLDTYTDNGARIRRVRRAPHIARERRMHFFHRFGLEMEVGLGNAVEPDVDPQVELRYSDDGAKTWSAPLAESAGKRGDYTAVVEWYGLGGGRDRVFEVSSDATVPIRLTGASIDVSVGIH